MILFSPRKSTVFSSNPMNMYLYHIALAAIGVIGFSIAAYISGCKKKEKPLVCPLRGNCNFVTESDYSKFLGIHVEYIGMSYYALIALLHLFLAFFPHYATADILRISLL